MRELNIFINDILEYTDVGGLHAPFVGELNNFVSDILLYTHVGGLHAPVISN
jgi:hypothetical protein